MGRFLENLENAWDDGYRSDSQAIPETDNMGREKFWEDISRPESNKNIFSEKSGIELTPTQRATIILNSIEQQIRNNIAIEIENRFHGLYHGASHDIAKFVKNGNSSI